MAEKAHSPIGASSCERWWNCPGSIPLIETVPASLESFYAAEGTAAHEVAEDALKKGFVDQSWLGETIEIGEHSITVDEEMLDGAQIYLDVIKEKMEQHFVHPTTLQVEVGFVLEHIDPEAFGTCDAAFCVPFSKLVVVDYKYGKGVVVKVAGNKQLLYYALGAFYSLEESDREELTGVELMIVQPRAFGQGDNGVRSVFYSIQELMVFEEELKTAVARVRANDPTLTTGDHCKFCKAKPVCSAMKKEMQNQCRSDFAHVLKPKDLPAPSTLTTEEVASLLGNAQLIKEWCDSVISYAHILAERGTPIPGYKLVDKFGNRRWKDPEEMKKAFELEFGDELYEIPEPKLLSPAKLEKLLGSKRKAEVNEFVEKPLTGKTLVPEGDKRPSVASDAQQDFAKMIEKEKSK